MHYKPRQLTPLGHESDIQQEEEVRVKTVVTEQKVTYLETQQETTNARLEVLQEKLYIQHQRLIMLQLQAEESENRSNVRVRGIPETVMGPDLRKAVTDIFNQLLEKTLDDLIELDQVHRVPTARNPDHANPRDVLC